MTTTDLTEVSAAPELIDDDRVLPGGWYTLAVMVALIIFGSITRQLIIVAAAPIMTSLALSDSELGLAQGVSYAIFSVAVIYLIAWAADRFDRRIVLGVCLVICSLGSITCGLARNFEQLFIGAFAVAAGDLGFAPIVTSFAPDLFKGRKRVLVNGIVFMASLLSIAGALALDGGVIGMLDAMHAGLPAWLQSFEPWRLAAFLVVLPAPVLLVLLAFTRLGHNQAGPAMVAKDGEPPHFWSFFRDNWAAMVTVLGGLGLFTVAINGFLAWLPAAATRAFATTPAENGTAMGVATGIGVFVGVGIGTLIVRRLIARMGPVGSVRFFWIGMLASLPVVAAFPFVGAAWQAFLLFALLVLTFNAIGAMIYTMLQDMVPAELRARMSGVWITVAGLAGGGAPALVGWTSGALGEGSHNLFIALGIVAVPSWLVGLLLFRAAERPFTRIVKLVAEMERKS